MLPPPQQSLDPWVAYVEHHAPEIRARFVGAEAEAIDALEHAQRQPLPPVQREFLTLVGGNRTGDLDPLLPDVVFDAGWLRERAEGAEHPPPSGWSLLMSGATDLQPFDLYLAPAAIDTPPDPEGRLRVVWATGHGAHLHGHAHNSTLLEYLLLHAHCDVRRATGEHTAVLGIHPRQPESEVRGRVRRDIFVHIAEHLGFALVEGTGDWWMGYEREDAAMWCYAGHDGLDGEVALMADDDREFRQLMHIMLDNLELYRMR